jgi:hypothetical protein
MRHSHGDLRYILKRQDFDLTIKNLQFNSVYLTYLQWGHLASALFRVLNRKVSWQCAHVTRHIPAHNVPIIFQGKTHPWSTGTEEVSKANTEADKTLTRTHFFLNISIITWNIWSWNESWLAGGQIDDPFAVRPENNYSYFLFL